MAEPKLVVDGTSVWDGGFNSSSSPHTIGVNQYVLGVNINIPDTNGGICNRYGYRHATIIFDNPNQEEIYRTGNVQGEGWYYDGYGVRYLCSVNGWVFEFTRISSFVFKGEIRNVGNQNNPRNTSVWISRIPFGAIINDGESSAIYLTRNICRRTRPKDREIGAGMMGVYVQNRFFYVLPDGRNIYASTINDPISLLEAQVDNIYGFISPEDEDSITAIGRQKTIGRDALGGNLSFSTNRNTYSVDVRGPRTQWGATAGKGAGYVENSVPDIGAVSAYSYESFNGNIYFRNSKLGLVSTKQLQSQFSNIDSYYSHSIEANGIFNNDSKIFLSKCYTRGFESKLYTTVAPQLKDGFVIWNGLIVYAPDIYYSNSEKAQRRYESIHTGIRPWCVTVSDDKMNGEEMLIHSHDFDGVNRIYILDKYLDFDIDKNGKKKEIESKILTRCYSHNDDFGLKQTTRAFYSLSSIPRDLQIKIFTRPGETGNFVEQWSHKHIVKSCSMNKTPLGKCFNPVAVHPENRELVNVKNDPDPKCPCSSNNPGNQYFTRQDLFEFKGAFTLRRWVRVAELKGQDTKVKCEEKLEVINKYNEFSIYGYKLSQ